MKQEPQHLELLTNIARMYYIYDLDQNEIAERVGLSRSYVSKMLTQARKCGIVKIEIVDPSGTESRMEKKLREMFGLERAIVVPASGNVSEVAASYISSNLKNNDTIGFSWGETVYSCAQAMTRNEKLKNITKLQLCGGISNTKRNIYVSEVMQRFSEVLDGVGYILPFPAIVGNKELKQYLEQELTMQEVLSRVRDIDMIIMTVGGMGTNNACPLERAGYLSEKEIDGLLKKGAVGDICTHIINDKGELCDEELDARTVAVPYDRILSAKKKIFIAKGAGKINGIFAALDARIPTVFITNEETIKMMQEKRPEISD